MCRAELSPFSDFQPLDLQPPPPPPTLSIQTVGQTFFGTPIQVVQYIFGDEVVTVSLDELHALALAYVAQSYDEQPGAVPPLTST